jgi:peptidoglycan hydrolase-like protein with peptidoglycan-binding domain
MDEPTLRPGSSGDWVYYLQEVLAQAGYDPGPIDGSFGAGTSHAVAAFQAAAGLSVDGIAGSATWAALLSTGEISAGEIGAGEISASDAVPSELVTAGAPASLAEWTPEQKEAFFEGTVSQSTEAGTPEDVPLLAIANPPSDENGQIA